MSTPTTKTALIGIVWAYAGLVLAGYMFDTTNLGPLSLAPIVILPVSVYYLDRVLMKRSSRYRRANQHLNNYFDNWIRRV